MKKVLLIIAIVVLVVVGAGLLWAGSSLLRKPQDNLDRLLSRTLNTRTAHVVLTTSTGGAEEFGQEASQVRAEGDIDLRDGDQPKAHLTLTTENPGVGDPKLNAEVIIAGNTYLRFDEFSFAGSPFEVSGAVKQSFYVTETDEDQEIFPTVDLSRWGQLSKESRKTVLKAAQDTSLFTLVADKGTETLDGKKTNHYTAKLNADAAVAFVKTLRAEQGKTLDTAGEQALQAEMNSIAQNTIDLWLGHRDGRLYRLHMAGTAKDQGIVDFDLRLTKYGKGVTIEAPASSKPMKELFTDLGTSEAVRAGLRDLKNEFDPNAQRALQDALEEAKK